MLSNMEKFSLKLKIIYIQLSHHFFGGYES